MHRHRSHRPHPAVAQGGAGRRGRRRVAPEDAPLDARAPLRVAITRCPGAEDLPLPARATAGAAGSDLCAAVEGEVVVKPGERVLVPTGFAIAVPAGYEAQVRPRSGLALRHGIILPNAPGTIDSDYRGELKVILQNAGDESFVVKRGDRIAQLVLAPVTVPEWVECQSLDDTDRADGGFGHTGVASSGGGEGGET